MLFSYTLIELLFVVNAFALPNLSSFQPHSTRTNPNLIAGVWSMSSLTLTNPDGTTSQPLGSTPHGRLTWTRGLNFVAEMNSGDYQSMAFNPPNAPFQPGTDAQNKVIVANSHSISGTYKVDSHGRFASATVLGSTIPNEIGGTQGPPTQMFNVSQNLHRAVERITQGGATFEVHWTKIEWL